MAKHILLIDDDPDELEIFIDALQGTFSALKFSSASGIDEALAFLKETIPDCIILDYNMPKINGIEGLVDLKCLPALKHVPIVMYSATMDEDLVKIAKELGAAGCIRKPYDMRKLPGLLSPYF